MEAEALFRYPVGLANLKRNSQSEGESCPISGRGGGALKTTRDWERRAERAEVPPDRKLGLAERTSGATRTVF